ncbi:hypothetical protein JCM9279_000695 [Rhodotorula babjevae]
MGVPTLWKELEAAVHITSYAQLVAPAFGRQGVRGFRLGVDVAQWLFHMGHMQTLVDADGNEVHPGANADLRLVFYRVCDFLAQGVLAVFVFDGPDRPHWKRDKKVTGAWRGRSEGDLIKMLELMGMEWRRAPGEAEAELAEMSKRGEVDAVLSDDVDCLLFGATSVIRNTGKNLSGNKSKQALGRQATVGADSASSSSQAGPSQPSTSQPVPRDYPPVPPDLDCALVTYSSADVAALAGLDRDQLILVALMSGADYDTQGLERVGVTISVALAKGGFATELLDGVRRLRTSPGPNDLEHCLADWRASVADELRTNSRGLMSRREKKLADTVERATAFPSLKIVDFYLDPRVSDPRAADYSAATWARDFDVGALVEFAQRKFEWGHVVLKSKLRNKLWRGLALREMRRAALAADSERSPASSSRPAPAGSTPPVPTGWLAGISDFKVENSTDLVPSYRVELSPAIFDALVASVLPARDPHPLPDYAGMDSDEERTARAKRKARGQAQEPPKAPVGATAFRHWVPREVVEACGEGRRAVRAWRDDKERKQRDKDEAAALKEERRRAREAAKASPTKARATASGGARQRTPSAKRAVAKPLSEDEELRREMDERRAKEAREEMLALARRGDKGKGKARAEDGVTSTRLRAPSRTAAAPGLLSFSKSAKTGRSGPSGFSSTKLALSSSPRAGSSKQLDVFALSSPPPAAPIKARSKPGKRAAQLAVGDVVTLSSTDESDDGAPVRRKVAHLDKAPRSTEKQRSPVKVRAAAPTTRRAAAAPVLELSSDDSSFAYDSDDAILARKGNRTQVLSSPEHESLADFMAKRRQVQERVEEKKRLLQRGVLVLDSE